VARASKASSHDSVQFVPSGFIAICQARSSTPVSWRLHANETPTGGVGKTSIACAAALALADCDKSVLLVSTDRASNLDEILDVPLGNLPVAVSGVGNPHVLNIDPTTAAESYRIRVLAQMGPDASDQDRNAVREQLSGACTTEIAAFDEFAGRLAADDGAYDHIILDTAPTGHTLRLLSTKF
jgi:arsenite/tail-anchored protein-transporting ATPase